MQITRESINDTTVRLTIAVDAAELEKIKQEIVARLGTQTRVPGFRPGKAPLALIEKHLDQAALQSEFLDEAVNRLYVEAVAQEKLRPVAQPTVNLTKFVPFSALEFTAEVASVGDIKLPDYKKIKLDKPAAHVAAKDVNEVIANLRERAATKQPVERAAKKGDEVVIDFTGVDAKTKAPIQGADGKDYPLALGSGSFIPGFEDELIGAKAGAVKTFDVTFPADYGVKTLQNKPVTFTVTVHTVNELRLPVLDDAFAASVGPFKTLAELKADIKKQLAAERQREAQQKYDNDLLEKIAAQATVAIPEALIEEEIDRLEEEEKRNLVYRGQTWEEHLAEEGITAEAHRAQEREAATLRVKAGLVLAEIADREQIKITPEELEIRIQLLKGQYPDLTMQTELDKPESRRDIHSRLMTEKTLDRLRKYAAKP